MKKIFLSILFILGLVSVVSCEKAPVSSSEGPVSTSSSQASTSSSSSQSSTSNSSSSSSSASAPIVVTIAQAIEVAKTVTVPSGETSAYTTQLYSVTGKISATYGQYWTSYGSFVIKEGTDELVIYKLYSADGSKAYKSMATKPQVNDVITVIGGLGYFSGGSTPVYQMGTANMTNLVIDEANKVPDAGDVENANHVIIYEACGGGGNNGSVYTNDYIILYNPTDASVSLTGWSLQYAAKDGVFAAQNAYGSITALALSGSIAAGKYYAIQLAAGSSNKNSPLPVTANIVGAINMSATDFKVAIVNSTEYITSATDSTVVDFLGVGAANMYEGVGSAEKLSSGLATQRKNFGDTNDNKADFKTVECNLDYLVG